MTLTWNEILDIGLRNKGNPDVEKLLRVLQKRRDRVSTAQCPDCQSDVDVEACMNCD